MRVLVADDNAELMELYRAALESAGYEVVARGDRGGGGRGRASAPVRRRRARRADARRQRRRGRGTLRVAKPKLPVLLVTGAYGDPFLGTSSRPVLHKPFTPEQLVDAVRALTG